MYIIKGTLDKAVQDAKPQEDISGVNIASVHLRGQIEVNAESIKQDGQFNKVSQVVSRCCDRVRHHGVEFIGGNGFLWFNLAGRHVFKTLDKKINPDNKGEKHHPEKRDKN